MEQKHNHLDTTNIPKLLRRLAIPATIGMLVNALYNLVDTIFIGQGVGADAIGGLAIAFPIQMVIMAIALMVGIGAASAISRSLGERNIEKANTIVGNAYVLCVFLSSIFVVIALAKTEELLYLFGATDTLLPYAMDYIRIIFIGSIPFSFVMTSNNIIRSEGNAKESMMIMIIGTGLNIILDPLFIFVFKMGIKGAALATILSQFVSFLYVIHYLRSGKSHLKVAWHHLKPHGAMQLEILKIGTPAFIRQIGGSFLAIFLNNALGTYGGDIAITSYGIVNRLIMFLFMPMFGVVQAVQPIAGYNYGARRYQQIRDVVKLSIRSLVIYATLGWLVILLTSSKIGYIFTKDAIVVDTVAVQLKYITLMLPIVGIQITSGTVFQAFGKAFPAMILSLLRQIIMLVPMLLLFPSVFGLGLLGIYIAFPISDVLSTLISGILLKREMIHLKHEFLDASNRVGGKVN
ncbi:MAG: MATE family efflux transporter [Clostridia bacterium]|nr:MATE family efflux transporter [Clostridia bacterium]